ncbi:hypothetical protein C2869_00365 [Saccharobesus litoralis]|uniref:DUF962 domain-containing protein n=1 Tax=Saccharobesus litoralis TaxID=2172099 RepID=A0A2S0VLB0_9ALTE|nr:Mpo1-like protein [Saccharobesus litoralis]AWB64986.1 hypothetical protein C2869_00365 [Saccharobesus litoralis]
MQRKLDILLDEYEESHLHPTNRMIHNLAVPLIYMSIIGLLAEIQWSIPELHFASLFSIKVITPVWFALVLGLIWYVRHSLAIFALMLCASLPPIICHLLYSMQFQLYLIQIWGAVFVLAWIAQFYGHKLEGKKPAFLRDIFFLLVGPAWVCKKILLKLGLTY